MPCTEMAERNVLQRETFDFYLNKEVESVLQLLASLIVHFFAPVSLLGKCGLLPRLPPLEALTLHALGSPG